MAVSVEPGESRFFDRGGLQHWGSSGWTREVDERGRADRRVFQPTQRRLEDGELSRRIAGAVERIAVAEGKEERERL